MAEPLPARPGLPSPTVSRGPPRDVPSSGRPLSRVATVRCAPAFVRRTGGPIAASLRLTTRSHGRLPSNLPLAGLPPSRRVYRVATPRPSGCPVAAVSRTAYQRVGVPLADPASGAAGGDGRQRHTGGRVPGTGRPVGTRRDTWQTLQSGTTRALCAAVLNGGFEVFLQRLRRADGLTVAGQDEIFTQLQSRAEQYYRGEVWPLRHAFGVLSRFINGTSDAGGEVLTPSVVTAWLSSSGSICCSCVGRTRHVGQRRAEKARAAILEQAVATVTVGLAGKPA